MGSANEGRIYVVTSSLVDWTHTQNDACTTIASDVFRLWTMPLNRQWKNWAIAALSGDLLITLHPPVPPFTNMV